jgi:ABC-2 type transport system permease protein
MRWRKVGVVAVTEFNNAVRTKMFLFSLFFLPLMIAGSIYIQTVLAKQVDTRPRRFAVVDQTGAIYDALQLAAAAQNKMPKDAKERILKAELLPERAESQAKPDDELLKLADRVRKEELYAFVVIPAGALDPKEERLDIQFYSNNPNDMELSRWLDATINAVIRTRRLLAAHIDPMEATRLSKPVPLESMTLPERVAEGNGQSGTIRESQKIDRMKTMLLPAGLMFMVYMIVMTTASPLTQAILEEKMSRISEVLLGSLTPFELMLGKLAGGVLMAATLAALYVGGAYFLAVRYNFAEHLSPQILLTLAVFVIMALAIYGSLYLALGSACTELRDAQALMTPVALMAALPLMLWFVVAQSPNSPLSVGLSLIPFATPYLMILRMAVQTPPMWQLVLAFALTGATVIVTVWAAAKIFRVGLLAQGKAPSFAQLAKWVMAK